MRTTLSVLAAIPGLLPAIFEMSAEAAQQVITLTKDDTAITQSCVIEIPSGAVIEDANQDGVLHINADNVTVRFKSGAELRGAGSGTPWNQLRGIGVRIQGHRNVTLKDLRVRGFKNGVVASDANGLVVDGGDYSDNYRQQLKSTPAAEDGADWLFPHNNDETKWRDQYGGAVCVESSTNVTIRNVRVRRGQNGIILDRVNDSVLYDNDCSFLSGWGLALWRSSRNRVTRNAFDFCVRGHVEGVYNRGQDSAGILCFEQCNDNLIAENSATHGGDCFFGFAGHDAIGEKWMNRERAKLRKETGRKDVDSLITIPAGLAKEMSALGCNRNLLIENDLSYSPAHGIEMTFSEGNRFIRNRLVENAICGVWGGYSSGTVIAENEFTGNGGMAYGLERGGINMEHAADNLIVKNRFLNNKCAIHLWWDDDGALLKFPGVAGAEKGVVGNVIAGNRFEINRDVPFRSLRADTKLILLQLRDSGQGRVASNYFFNNQVKLDHPQAVEFAVKPGCEPLGAGQTPRLPISKYRALGRTHPVGARNHLRGRDQIVMDEWGPWDHESPLVRPAISGSGEHVFDVFGLRKIGEVKVLQGDVAAQIVATNMGSPTRDDMKLRIRARSGVARYRVRLVADGFEKELTGTIVAAAWSVRMFPWKVDPRENLVEWRKLAEGPDARSAMVPRLDFPFGMGGPRDLKISESITRDGPGGDHFGLIAQTALKLPKGRWRFRTNSDDGVRVMVNGKPVIENWTWHVPTTNDAIFDQPAEGEVSIVVEYFEIDGFATLRLDIDPAAK
jgi:parallel beta-helix repeat protein